MRVLGLFSTLALAAVVSCAPLTSPEASQIEARTLPTGCTPLPVIIGSVSGQVTPYINELKSLPASACTVANIRPIVEDIKGCLNSAIGQVKNLNGLDASAVLSTDNGVMSIPDLCKLITTLYSLIFGCLSAVLGIAASGDYNGVLSLFAEIGSLCGTLLQLCCGVVGGLAVVIYPMLSGVLSVAGKLGITNSFSFLGSLTGVVGSVTGNLGAGIGLSY
ncbi:hypothetical protein VKT23_013297 [Stygiomarasmius scandens]|uniref:Secreted protein n=1 Tax=Marasmiellus scandens TaxID=2682957 RepID=A0ABR1J6R8_9AGAR